MSVEHISDDEILEFLDGNLPAPEVTSIEDHLKNCPACQEALRQYQNLYEGLSSEEDFVLSKGFAKSVVSRLQAVPQEKPRINYVSVFWVILGIFIGVGVTIKFVDLKTWGDAINKTVLSQFEFGSVLIDSIKAALVVLNGNVGLVIAAVLALSLFATLDRFVLQPKYRRI
jgi:anti-sigma factor RsiW